MGIDTGTPETRSRRAILAGAIGGVAGLIGSRFVNPARTSAAAGGPVIMGAANSAGTSNTSLATSSSGTALLVTQNGAGTALRGSAVGAGSIAGFFTATNGTGISGVTGNGGTYGVFAQNNGAAGIAGALRASGVNNHGVVATTANAGANAVKAINTAVGGVAVFGEADGAGVGGLANGELGTAVIGVATSPTGTTSGVEGRVVSASGNGVVGVAFATSFGDGAAVRAYGQDNHGVAAQTENDVAYAVKASHHGSNGIAVWAEVTQTDGGSTAVHGEIGGAGNAVVGYNSGIVAGSGVYGQANSQNGIGVTGLAISLNGPTGGVYGVTPSTSGKGVIGTASALTGITYGVYGLASSPSGFGVYSQGNAKVAGALDVTGAITAGVKDFRIDHPLDPSQKFLSHSCVESDDRRTVYDGEVTLDAKGEATVTLPAWFGALNRDPRYQLTAIGKAAGDLHVKARIANSRFTIAGGEAGLAVSWQVTAIRQDAYAKAHPLTVEAAKTGAERGRYLHPEVHGKAPSTSIDALHATPAPVIAPIKASPAPGH